MQVFQHSRSGCLKSKRYHNSYFKLKSIQIEDKQCTNIKNSDSSKQHEKQNDYVAACLLQRLLNGYLDQTPKKCDMSTYVLRQEI